MLLKQSRRQ